MLRLMVMLAALLAPPAIAQPLPPGCEANFAGGTPPAVDVAHSPQTKVLCFRQFAVQHSGLTKTPLWSAEHLTVGRVRAADAVIRVDTFHAEKRLPAKERATLNDYKASGFDRGHMSPSGDMPDAASQQESFSLANMVPQAPCSNELLWERIEFGVRAYVVNGHEVYVVTGPIFDGASLATIGNDVAVPTRIYKALFEPATGQAGVYVTANDNDATEFATLTLAELQDLTGVDAFPSVPAAAKGVAAVLPPPSTVAHHRCRVH